MTEVLQCHPHSPTLQRNPSVCSVQTVLEYFDLVDPLYETEDYAAAQATIATSVTETEQKGARRRHLASHESLVFDAQRDSSPIGHIDDNI